MILSINIAFLQKNYNLSGRHLFIFSNPPASHAGSCKHDLRVRPYRASRGIAARYPLASHAGSCRHDLRVRPYRAKRDCRIRGFSLIRQSLIRLSLYFTYASFTVGAKAPIQVKISASTASTSKVMKLVILLMGSRPAMHHPIWFTMGPAARTTE